MMTPKYSRTFVQKIPTGRLFDYFIEVFSQKPQFLSKLVPITFLKSNKCLICRYFIATYFCLFVFKDQGKENMVPTPYDRRPLSQN